jgi:nicotinate-nucleotide adenylyltransferase
MMTKIGIISGVFDPVHIGHIKLAKKAQSDLSLDQLYFLCEEKPRAKKPQASFKQRQEMLKLAADEFNFAVLNLSSPTFSVDDLSLISAKFKDDQIYLIMGSDAKAQSESWFKESEFSNKNIKIIGYDRDQIAESVSSGRVKLNIQKGDYGNLPTSVAAYIKLNQLYKL